MRRLGIFLVLLSGIFFLNIIHVEADAIKSFVNIADIKAGVIGIEYIAPQNKKTKIIIEKQDKRYIYNVSSAESYNVFPLQLGNGEYTVRIMENTTGNNYNLIQQATVELNLTNDNSIYLNSIQNIKWDDSMEAVKKAKELTKNAKTNNEKIKAIYSYIVSKMNYDTNKAKNLEFNYLPDINQTYSSNKGICYDYAALFAAMSRSLDIPTKLVMGNTKLFEGFHAWNEVLLEGKWQIIDTTVDSTYKKHNFSVSMFKKSKDYQTVSTY